MAKPAVPIDTLDPSATADALWEVLDTTNDRREPHTVGHLGRLCRFGVDDASGRLELREHDIDTLRDTLTEHLQPVRAHYADGWVLDDDDGPVRTKIPNEALTALVKRPLDRLDRIAEVPRVDRIVDVPVFGPGPDYDVLTEPGYHSAVRAYFHGEAFEVSRRWEDIDARYADVSWARELLMDDFLGDFPFADDASRAHALALLLEQFVRGMIDEPVPAHVIQAPEQGTGKGLLAQACLLPACGHIDLGPEPDASPQDFQKRLLSELIRGPQAIVFDNVTRELENSALATMITTGRYADRVLGKSQILSFPVSHTTVFTVNSAVLGPDMRRRVLPIYLDAHVERPWEREGPAAGRKWQHPNLLKWAAENRGRLVKAALTLVLHWTEGWDEDAREAPLAMHRSFSEWSRVVGGIVTAAGVPGFASNLDRLLAEQSDSDDGWAALLAALPLERTLTSADIVSAVTVGLDGGLPVAAPDALCGRDGHVTTRSAGYGLRAMKDRVRGGRRLTRAKGIGEWVVVESE